MTTVAMATKFGTKLARTHIGRPCDVCVLQISAVALRRRAYKYRSSRLPHSLKQRRPSSSDRLSVVLRATASLSHFSLLASALSHFPPFSLFSPSRFSRFASGVFSLDAQLGECRSV